MGSSRPLVGVCWKWVDDAAAPGDQRYAGVSPADQAALELALRQAADVGAEVLVALVGPPAAEEALRDALAVGAHRVLLIATDAPLSSHAVANELASVLADAITVWCGDYSLDRGTGCVPAFLAADLGAAQMLGAVAVERTGTGIRVTRRLDGGRREVLFSDGRAVVSVEGSVAHLRRASMASTLRSRSGTVPTVTASAPVELLPPVHAYRPRARAVAAPDGNTLQRLQSLTDAAAAPARGELVHLDSSAAADRIIRALTDWGYLD